MICSDNSSLTAIAMQNNGLFNQRSVRETIDLKRYLLCAHVRNVVAFLLVSIVIFFLFPLPQQRQTGLIKYFLFNLQMSRNTYTRDLYTRS